MEVHKGKPDSRRASGRMVKSAVAAGDMDLRTWSAACVIKIDYVIRWDEMARGRVEIKYGSMTAVAK